MGPVVGFGNCGSYGGLGSFRGLADGVAIGGYSGGMGISLGGGRSEGIRGVSIHPELLKPLCVGVDPEECQVRTHEKEQIKNLNNQFACFIDKVSARDLRLASLGSDGRVVSRGTRWGAVSSGILVL